MKKINVTTGKEAAKRKVPEVERPEESWGNATHEKDQGLRKAGGPAKGKGSSAAKGALPRGRPKPGN